VHIDASEDSEEGMFGTITDVHLMKMIIIQCTVIDPFSGGPVLIDLLPSFRTVGERAACTDVITIVDVSHSAIGRGAAFIEMITGIDLSHDERASVLLSASLDVIAKADHLLTAGTDRDAIFINGFIIPCSRICGM